MQYLEHAGKAAVGRSAPREAGQHFTKAIGLLTTWPESPARRQHELSRRKLMRGAALMATKWAHRKSRMPTHWRGTCVSSLEKTHRPLLS